MRGKVSTRPLRLRVSVFLQHSSISSPAGKVGAGVVGAGVVGAAVVGSMVVGASVLGAGVTPDGGFPARIAGRQ